MAGNVPGTKYSTASFLNKFGNLAQTSQYRAHIVFPSAVRQSLLEVGMSADLLNEIGILCKATSLPGSSLATHDVMNDFYGVQQKHAYKRQFDNTIDLTFFIDKDYQTLYTFEGWMEYIMPLMGQNQLSRNVYYNAQYPESYRAELYLYKFNKDHYGVDGFRENARPAKFNYGKPGDIVYTFIGAFPQNISSASVSYDPSSNLEFTVTFAYERYVTDKTGIRMPKMNQLSGGSQPNLSSPKDNPSKPQGFMRWLAGAADVVTRDAFDFDKRGTAADGARRLKNNMLNKSIDVLSGMKSQAVSGQNVNNGSTQQINDARNGAGSNTTVRSSKTKSTSSP